MRVAQDSCWIFHKWKYENGSNEESFTHYQRCSKCKSKRIMQGMGMHQPVDFTYLDK